MRRLKMIKDYCDYELIHCQDQIRLLDRIAKNRFYQFIHRDAELQKENYKGRLQIIKKINQILET